MPKCSLKNRLLQLRLSTCVTTVLCLVAIINFFSFYGKYNYSHINPQDIPNQLYKEIASNIVLKKSKPDCEFENILKSTKTTDSWDAPKKNENFKANNIVNGSYVPEECNPMFSVAVIVTYRNRQKHLDVFLPYMHNFLRKQQLHYKIYLIEQEDKKPWNKGLLYNIGAKRAIAEKFPCLILHDVDLLPLDESNLYACLNNPRHMSASIDKFRYVLTYDYLVGGVLAITADQFVKVNGFSNRFEGWGGEDDDFYERLSAHGFNVVRFPPRMSRYTMLVHPQEPKNSRRHQIMAENLHTKSHDGYDSVHYQTVDERQQKLFTHLRVKL